MDVLKRAGGESCVSAATSPSSSTSSSSEDLKSMDTTASHADPGGSKGKSLAERARIPPSFLLTAAITLSLQFMTGIYSVETFQSWQSSMTTSAETTFGFLEYFRALTRAALEGDFVEDPTTYVKVFLMLAVCFLSIYVFLLAPLRAGLWTGARARRHKFHRYMGLAYLVQYFFAWVEFGSNYENGGATSYLPHFIALNGELCLSSLSVGSLENGLCFLVGTCVCALVLTPADMCRLRTGLLQSMSAFISFKVLPELEDAGYYSDKAVLSRNFIHENVFFTLMCVYGSIYYNEHTRQAMRSHWAGKVIEYTFVFGPYVLIRTWFPITRFKDAGTTRNGRTDANERFYKIATTMVKIFFLWAKYLIGFFTNFLVFLDLVEDWRFVHGLFLLNVGTVSLAMFLHTLRFKKVLPPRFTMSFYLGQIYLTFTAIPLAFEMFASHLTLLNLCVAGLLCNMTRNRKIHAAWCLVAMALLGNRDYRWLSREIDW